MKTFLQYLSEAKLSRKYVCVKYNAATQKKLRDWCQDNDFNLAVGFKGREQNPEDFTFHTTIFYSENRLDLAPTKKDSSGSVKVVGIKLLGEDSDIPVLGIQSDDIQKLRKEYDDLGLKDKWPDYIPHISVSYERKQYDLSKIQLPTFNLIFDELVIEDIQEDGV